MKRSRSGRSQGILTADREDAIWPMTQEYTAPDGSRRTRHGILARVRVTDYGPGKVRPHERTQPGPKEDRLRLTRATRHNMSPIFSLYAGDAWGAVEAATAGEPWGEVTDDDGTVHRVWRVADPGVLEAVTGALADSELLIADGHHRYETARTYADEIGGEGAHRYTLMCLVSLDDPGLTVFPTHRLLTGLDPSRYEPLGAGLKELFDVEEVPLDQLDPTGEEGVGVFGYVDSHLKRGFRLRLRDTAQLDEALARTTRGLPPPRRGDPRDPRAQGHPRDDRGRHRRQARDRLLEGNRRRARADRVRERRLRLPAAPHPGRAGPRRSRPTARRCRRSRPTSFPRC